MNGPEAPRSQMPGTKTLAVMGVLLVLAALYLTIWWPFQQRVALVRDLDGLRGNVITERRGPEWLWNLTGYYHRYGLAVNPRFGILDRVVTIDFDGHLVDHQAARNMIPQMEILTDLEELSLDYGVATDDCLVQVSRLKSIKKLNLSHSRVSGRGFGRLKQMPNLETVNVSYSPVRDQALEHLKVVPKLRWVRMWGCRHLTPAGVADFERARPDVELGGATIEVGFGPKRSEKNSNTTGEMILEFR